MNYKSWSKVAVLQAVNSENTISQYRSPGFKAWIYFLGSFYKDAWASIGFVVFIYLYGYINATEIIFMKFGSTESFSSRITF